jgi:hypothetical protein
MATLSVRTWIGNAAAVLCGGWGAVARQTQQAGCSRQVAYDHAQRVQQAVRDAQLDGPTRAELLHEVQELRAENRALWAWLEQTIDFPQAKQQQFAVTAAAWGFSVRQIVALLALLLAPGTGPSRARVSRWVTQYAQRASRLLVILDQACSTLVLVLCLDEIFCRRRPILVGVEPRSLTWVLGRRAVDRSGPTWCQALAAWPRVTYVTADGGSGLRRGLELTRQRRGEAGPPLPLDTNLDNFHIQQEGQRSLRREWQVAERLWGVAEEADKAVAQANRQGQDRRGVTQRALKAWAKAEQAFHTAEHKEAAWRRAVAALAVFRPDGRLNDRTWADAELVAAVAALTGSHWAKTCRMLRDPRALTFLERLHADLAVAEPRADLREALVALWRWQPAGRSGGGLGSAEAHAQVVVQLQVLICQRLEEQWPAAYRRVATVLRQVVRASSVVECMNSVLRMHQARHRRVTQGLLDLKRLSWNCREFAEGKRRGQCPYQHLGLELPIYQAWELLQMDPQELARRLGLTPIELTEEVSTGGLAA